MSLTMLGDGSQAAGARKVIDAAAVLLGRSPGERTVAVASKGASSRTANFSKAPARPPVTGPSTPPSDLVDVAVPVETVDFFPASGEDVIAAAPGVPGIPAMASLGTAVPQSDTPFFGGVVPQVGGGTPPGTVGGVDNPVVTPNEPPVVSAVPEPETWLMMLTGFGLLGGRLRLRRRNRSLSAARTQTSNAG